MALAVNSPEISIVNKISVSPSKSLKTVSLLKKDETPLLISRVKVAYNLNRTVKLHTQFSVPVIKEATKRTKEEEADEDKQNYYVNMGYAIRTLREDFPDLFYRELTFDIYREDIVFKDPFNTFAGIENYKSIFWALRFHGRLFFRALWIDIISVWQPMENVIMVRWTVHGIPRVPWESRARFDGTSEYKLDRKGKIFEHQVHNIALNSPPKFRVRAVEDLIQSIGCPSTPKPTYFEVSSSSSEVD